MPRRLPAISEMNLSTRFSGGHWQTLLKLSCLVFLIIAANFAVDWLADTLRFEFRPSNEDFVNRTIIISAIAYAFLIAIPFVPGVEIGLTLIAMLGPAIVLLVYLSTIVGLLASFAVGRLISLKALIPLLEDLHLRRASQLLTTIEPMKMDDRLAFLVSKTPNRLVPFLLRHRYITLAIVVNLPGNILIGGGGGIALIAGTSRLFSLFGFLITIAFAVSPVPLAILLFGKEILR